NKDITWRGSAQHDRGQRWHRLDAFPSSRPGHTLCFAARRNDDARRGELPKSVLYCRLRLSVHCRRLGRAQCRATSLRRSYSYKHSFVFLQQRQLSPSCGVPEEKAEDDGLTIRQFWDAAAQLWLRAALSFIERCKQFC